MRMTKKQRISFGIVTVLLSALFEQNSECIGWLCIPDTADKWYEDIK